LNNLGIIYEIKESQFEIYTDITSCAPGIFSSIFSEFIKSACKHGSINDDDALTMFIQTLYGLSKMYKEKHIDFNETIARVARKGGITEVGIAVVKEKAPSLFDEIFDKTLAKHEMRKQEFKKEFS
jgi:pyrroline-5-carboxylate reductase